MSINAVKEFLSPEVLQRYQVFNPQHAKEESTAPATTAEASDSRNPEQSDVSGDGQTEITAKESATS